ncbi:uncharacterized protein E0L32_006249 [Thyridium curvatum]|uniref:Breast carcinoma amplified sequence 2 n=1 Tax=Thyridium curvatum TaxID=1093900 RepID=A0A507B2H1_9PEZI|nr:uncharacterized protein E0L32_006249 [Thyridium curvatum]TPX13276.1 hypothetical protein E0L32_006249 [Thyridium curvatum]
MPSITTIHESLPYPAPTASERAAAEALIAAERAAVPDDPYHALLPPPHRPAFTPALAAELARVGAHPRQPLRAIDLSRYEAPELPDVATDSSSTANCPSAEDLRSALERAYASRAYLAQRRAHLALLDSHGKNSWLVGNWQLEAELAGLEAELAAARRDVDLVTLRRQKAQADVAGEVATLEENWRRGVGRVLETELAAEELRQKVLEARRLQG